MTQIVIAGGGIAGLTAALSLHAAGFTEVTVVEAALESRPVGAGLNIMPNAVRELDALGLLERLEGTAVRTRELRYYHRSGGLISREPRGRTAGYRWPQLSMPRGDLRAVLAEAVRERLGARALIPGARVTAVEHLPDGRARIELECRSKGPGAVPLWPPVYWSARTASVRWSGPRSTRSRAIRRGTGCWSGAVSPGCPRNGLPHSC